ncbi:MAG: hypothetical protein MUF80_11965 [Burkholderiales bacterium]|nr:hypothetical protein [Burkholderiales bacterium]
MIAPRAAAARTAAEKASCSQRSVNLRAVMLLCGPLFSQNSLVGVALVVVDVAPGQRGLVQVPRQRLVSKREVRESVGVQLNDRRVLDALEQVRAVAIPGWTHAFQAPIARRQAPS